MQETTGIAYEMPLIPIRYVRLLVRFMEGKGIGQQALLSQGVIDEKTLNDPEALVSMKQTREVLGHVHRLLPEEMAAFQFGQQLDLVAHGLLGFTLLKRRSQRELVQMVVHYLRVALPVMDMDVQCAGENVHIRLSDIWPLEELRPFLVKVYMGSIHALISLVCKRLRFEFDFPAFLSDHEWQRLAPGSDVRFNSADNQVVVMLSDKQLSYRETDLPYYVADVYSKSGKPQENTAGNVMEVVMQVRQYLLNHPGRRATLEHVAEELGMSARSVRRHLGIAGLSFHDLRKQIRETFATRYLKDSRVPLTKIADILGYSDQASFTKAYRAWTGETPGYVRRRALEKGARI